MIRRYKGYAVSVMAGALICLMLYPAFVCAEETGNRSQAIPVIRDHDETGKDCNSKAEEDLFTLVMVGDILLHDGIEKCSRQEDGSYDFSEIFRHTKHDIAAADLAIVNQEVIIGGKELRVSGYPSFNAPYEIADDLAKAGFDVICHATNHALDRGKKGIENCLDYWARNHPEVDVIGIYGSKEDRGNICVYERKGYRIAVLNYTYGTNGIPLPEDMPYAVALLDEAEVKADLAKAEKLADFTIVCPHWGTEYDLGISETQKKWAKVLVNNGADLIIGTHPHVIEPVETVTADDGRPVPVYYSIGNFINWTSGSGRGVANRMVGAMALVVLEKDTKGEVSVRDYGVKPVVAHVESVVNGSTVYFLDDYTQAKSFLNGIRSRDPDFSYIYCEDLCNKVFGSDLRRQ